MSLESTNVFSVTMAADVLLVISNIFFIIPAATATRLHRYTFAAVYFLIIFTSGSYHLCKSFSSTCLFEAEIHMKMDFFTAQLIIPLTALYIIYFRPAWRWLQRWLIIAIMFTLFVLEITIGVGFVIQLILSALSFAIIALYWIGYAIYQKKKSGRARIPTYNWENFFLGIALSILACMLFVTQNQFQPGYWAIHSLWHVIAAIAQYFILLIRPAEPRYAAVDRRIKW